MNAQHRRDPRNGSYYEQQRVQESTLKCDTAGRTDYGEQQHANTNPGINAEVKPAEGKGKRGTG